MKKPKARYEGSNGERLPGSTTICKQLGWNKDRLIIWSNGLGLEGIDYISYINDKADIGTLAHVLVLAHATGEKVDTSEYTSVQIKQAENCLLSYYEWLKGKTVKPILVEKMLVSELGFGGTPDFYGEINGVKTLLDYKTGSGIYSEHTIQVASYKKLIEEAGHEVNAVTILNIPRTEDESFQVKLITEKMLFAGWEIFKNLLNIYRLKNAITKE